MKLFVEKWENGQYKLVRKLINNNLDKLELNINDDILKISGDKKIRSLSFETEKKILIWFEGLRLGLLYELEE